jgi:hypothetical protein
MNVWGLTIFAFLRLQMIFNCRVLNPRLNFPSNKKTNAGFCGTNIILKENGEETKRHEQAISDTKQ